MGPLWEQQTPPMAQCLESEQQLYSTHWSTQKLFAEHKRYTPTGREHNGA